MLSRGSCRGVGHLKTPSREHFRRHKPPLRAATLNVQLAGLHVVRHQELQGEKNLFCSHHRVKQQVAGHEQVEHLRSSKICGWCMTSQGEEIEWRHSNNVKFLTCWLLESHFQNTNYTGALTLPGFPFCLLLLLCGPFCPWSGTSR